MEDHLHAKTLGISKIKVDYITDNRENIKDLNAHGNHIQNAPPASHKPRRIQVFELSPEM